MTNIINDLKVFKPSYRDAEKSYIPDIITYKTIYDKSVKDPESFWAEQAERLDWIKKWDKISNNDFDRSTLMR